LKEIIQLKANQAERGIIVGVITPRTNRIEEQESLAELNFLAKTAHVEIIKTFIQTLPSLYPATYIGKGKMEEIKLYCQENDIAVILFDDDLSPAQVKNLEKEIERKIIDRSGLILDIFASRAKSKEAITQVKLAQMQYLLPRLSGMWTHLSKQYGGVGTKGPGETQIETDRRLVKTKISQLKHELREIETERFEQRKKRKEMFRVSLVGYTNAGKSTLMNLLSNADVFVEDLLFATLDTTIRQVEISSTLKILLSDTVGFIRKLPPNLIASFKSTLSEVLEADLLLHVVDVSYPNFINHIDVVNSTLEELNTLEIPTLLIFNKIDRIKEREQIHDLKNTYSNAIFISAQRGINIETLKESIAEKLQTNWLEETLTIPQSNNRLLAQLHEVAEIVSKDYVDNDIIVKVRIQKKVAEQVEKLLKRKVAKEVEFY